MGKNTWIVCPPILQSIKVIRHPKIVKAMQEQLETLTLTSRAFNNNMLGPFLKKLCEFTGMEVALPMNTGAEAVETGMKIAR